MFVFLQEIDENTDMMSRLGIEAKCCFYPLPIKEIVIITECWSILYVGHLHFQFSSIQSVYCHVHS